jgi:glucose-1-phosphate thymidylyltransferase
MKVAGKPVLAYILDDLVALGVEEFVFIVGYLREPMEAWIRAEYPDLNGHYVLQEVQDGTAGAVALAEPWVDQDVLIVFPDAILEVDYASIRDLDADFGGVIYAKEVEDYQRYGVIVTNDDGTMARIVEKPSEPISKLANIGLYYIRDWKLLYEGVHHALNSDPGPSGEFYLTDAFQYMVDNGSRILTGPVEGWWDAGKPETLLETNAHLLEGSRGGVDEAATIQGAEIIEPVRIEAGALVSGGRIGPHVTLEAGARVDGCEIRNSVVGAGATLANSSIANSIIGARAVVRDMSGELSVTDDSTVEGGTA